MRDPAAARMTQRRDFIAPTLRAHFPLTTRAMTIALCLTFVLHLAAQGAWFHCAQAGGAAPYPSSGESAASRQLHALGVPLARAPACTVQAAYLKRSFHLIFATGMIVLLLGVALAVRTPDAAATVERNRLRNAPGMSPASFARILLLVIPGFFLFGWALGAVVDPEVLTTKPALAIGNAAIFGACSLWIGRHRFGPIVIYTLHLLRHGRPPDPLPDLP